MLKVFGLHYSDSAVADYRIWTPWDGMNEKKLAECKRLPDDSRSLYMPIRASETDPVTGSYETHGAWADVLVTQRIDSLNSLAAFMATRDMFGRPLVMDLDDDPFSVPPSNEAYSVFRPAAPGEGIRAFPLREDQVAEYRKRKDGMVVAAGRQMVFVTLKDVPARDVCVMALKEVDAVTCTTEVLANVFRHFNPYVFVLPNCLRMKRWLALRPPQHEKIRVAWLGGKQHMEDLEILRDVVPAVLKAHPNVEFVTTFVIPDFWADLAGQEGRFRTIPYAPVQRWPEYLASQGIDIALVPLVSNTFNRSKSNIKFLEFGALRIPGVFSPIDPYLEVEHGKTGMFAATTEEWIDSIGKLVSDEVMRKKIGNNACAYVRSKYDILNRAREWTACYEETLARVRKMRKKAGAAT